jgi:hypothetical protein
VSIKWLSSVWTRSPYRGERLLLHLALADFANDEGTCFPSVRTLAHKARCSEVWARKGIQQMIDDGLLEIVERGLGRGNVNRYRLLSLVREEITQLPLSREGVTTEQVRGNSEPIPTTTQNHQEPSIDDQFSYFWKAYPRKVGRAKARLAFERAMARKDSPTLEELLAAVARYALSVADPKYIAHATTWLNGERWTDELDAPKVASAIIQSDPTLRSAESTGAAFALTGRTLDDLMDLLASKSDAERNAARDSYNHTRGRNSK